MYGQDREQLSEIVMVKHFDDLVFLCDFIEVTCDSLQIVSVYLFVDEVFDFLFPFYALLDLLTGVKNCCHTRYDVGIKGDSDKYN